MLKTMMIVLVWIFCIGISIVVIRKNLIAGLILGVAMVCGAYTVTKFISVGSKVAESAPQPVLLTDEMIKKLPASPDVANARAELPGMISKIMGDAPVNLDTNLYKLATEQKGKGQLMSVLVYLGSVMYSIGEVYKEKNFLRKMDAKFEKNYIFRLTPAMIAQTLQEK